MLQKIIGTNTIRYLPGLSKTLLRQGSSTSLQRYSSQLLASTYTKQPNSLFKTITGRNVFTPTVLQTSKILGNSLLTTRNQSTHGSHVNIWKLERIVSAAFLPLFPLCFLTESAVLDGSLAVLSVIHVHWGLESIIVDYARPIVVGPVLPKVLMLSLYVTSALTLAGLLSLIYNGPGLSKVIKQGWAIGKDN